MISYKFSGHQNSNLFIRVDSKLSCRQLWTRWIVPLILKTFSVEDISSIKRALGLGANWDDGFCRLLDLGAMYLNQNRLRKEFDLDSSDCLKIHLMPRRYDIGKFQNGNSIVFETGDYLVVNKPAGLPVHPTVDNMKENLLSCLQTRLAGPVFNIHRLDVETTGLILFAKNEISLRYFQDLFSKRKIEKYYKAITTGRSLELGTQQHWMLKGLRAPKKIVSAATNNASLVELKVVSYDRFTFDNSYLADLELLTGKTHQIRSQLSFLGCPLIGDTLYDGPDFPAHVGWTHYLLHAYRLEFVDPAGQKQVFEQQPIWLPPNPI